MNNFNKNTNRYFIQVKRQTCVLLTKGWNWFTSHLNDTSDLKELLFDASAFWWEKYTGVMPFFNAKYFLKTK